MPRPPSPIQLRPYSGEDADTLAEVYRQAATALGRQAYTPEQTAAWARHPKDLEAFRAALGRGLTLCAVVEASPVAFGQLEPEDRIAHLYCHPDHARGGLASAILARLEAHALAQDIRALRVEASGVARPLFERRGYRVVAAERPVRHGIEFLRYRMTKALDSLAVSPPV